MVRTCSQCGAVNRIPPRHLADTGRCGRCKAALGPVDAPFDAPDARSFDEVVRESRVPVLVDFWATWCGPCRMAAPEVAKAARTLAGRAIVVKVDTDRLTDVAARYQIQSIPTFMVFAGGRPLHRQAGLVREAQLVRWVEQGARAA